MIVRCENCQTEFSLDTAQVPPEGATVRCSVCAYVFKVEPSSESADAGWQIRTIDDMLFTAPDVGTMMRWIEEGRLHPDDQVSRTGRNWLRLGDMAEFAHLFGADLAEPLFKPVAGATAEISAVDELGPPPAFGGTPETPDAAPVFREDPGTPPPPPGSSTARPSSLLAKGPVTRPPVAPAESSGKTASWTPSQIAAAVDGPPLAGAPSPSPEPVKSSNAGWVAAAAILLGVGIVFGVPSIRNKVLNIGAPEADPVAAATGATGATAASAGAQEELKAADAALAGLGVEAVSSAESALQLLVDRGELDQDSFARARIKQAELLAARGLSYQMAAVVEPEQAQRLRAAASDDLDAASRILDGLGANAPKDDATKVVRARVRLLEGRSGEEVAALLPDDPTAAGADAEETSWVVKAAALWSDEQDTELAKRKLDEGVLAGLEGLEKPSALGQAALVLARIASGDEQGAQELAKRMEARAEDNPVAQAALGKLDAGEGDGDDDGDESEGGGDEAAADDGGELIEDDPKPTPTKTKKPVASSTGGGGGGASRFDALLDKGCQQVKSGQASAGVKTLLKAFDISPNDLDVMACLAQGYEGMGNASSALTFYERVLSKSPNHRVGLRRGAALYAKRGRTEKALKLYKRLLKVDPNDATAKAYVAANDKSAPAPAPTPAPTPAPAGGGGDTQAPPKQDAPAGTPPAPAG